MESRKDGSCIKCGSDNMEQTGQGKFFNEKFFETMKCNECKTKFDIVYDLVLKQSQEVKTMDELIKRL